VPVFGPGGSPWAASDPAWQIRVPVSGSERPVAAQLLAGDEAWVVGTGGLVLHCQDGVWGRESAGTSATLTAVACPNGMVLAVGTGGTALLRDGAGWRREETGTDATLRALLTMPDGTTWAAGDRMTLLTHGGEGWRRQDLPWTYHVVPDATCLASLADTLLIGTSSGQVLALWDGGWRELARFSPVGVTGLAVSAGGEIFASGDSIRACRGGSWRTLPCWGTTTGTLAVADSLLVLAGRSIGAWTFDGNYSESVPYWGARTNISALSIPSLARAVAVSEGGEIGWLRDGRWSNDPAGVLGGHCCGLLDGSVLTLNEKLLCTLRSGLWTPVRSLPAEADTMGVFGSENRCDGASLDDFYLCSYKEMLHWDGGWSVIPIPRYPRAVAVENGGQVLLLDRGGRVLSRTGSDWRPEIEPVFSLRRDAAGNVLAWDGRALRIRSQGVWSEPDSIGSYGSFQIAGVFPDRLYLIDGSRWRHWDPQADPNAQWVNYAFPAGITAQVAAVASGTDQVVVATGYPSAVLRLEVAAGSATWRLLAGPVADTITTLTVALDGSLTAISYDTGRIYVYPTALP
jgi:hypothetical protein